MENKFYVGGGRITSKIQLNIHCQREEFIDEKESLHTRRREQVQISSLSKNALQLLLPEATNDSSAVPLNNVMSTLEGMDHQTFEKEAFTVEHAIVYFGANNKK